MPAINKSLAEFMLSYSDERLEYIQKSYFRWQYRMDDASFDTKGRLSYDRWFLEYEDFVIFKLEEQLLTLPVSSSWTLFPELVQSHNERRRTDAKIHHQAKIMLLRGLMPCSSSKFSPEE